MIPERLIRRGNRREIDALVGYELMLIKHNYLNSIVTTVAPMLLLLLWRAYMYQHSASGNLTLFREAGVAFSALVAFQKSVRGAYLQAEEAFHKAGGDAEGWIAGLARAGKLAGSPKSPELFSRIAKSYNIAPERIPELVEQGFPETGKYPVPDFSRSNLILLS
jgi:hypothetical protein